uniref:Plant heme peroxidase family profile domain-containing protein n=1 Tax=Aegilops tauschii subsp. strangulata TaxID=200361 RepID=A0A453NFE5_AEGTS
RMGFYDKSCPAAERIVGDYVRLHVRRVPTVAPALLRTHYHDCFVRVRTHARTCTRAFHSIRARDSMQMLHQFCAYELIYRRALVWCGVVCVHAGLRWLHPAQLHGRRRGGEGRAAEPDAAGVRPHRPRQGPRRGGLPRRRLLRRRPRARRPGRRRRHWRSVVARADGEEGRHGVDHAGGGPRAAVAVDDLPAARRPVRRQGPRRARPRLAVRCAHHRHRPLLLLRRPPLQLPQRRQRHRDRPAPRRRLRRQPAAAQVQDGRPRRRGGDGPRQLPDVRPRLLPHCAQAQGPVPVRRRAGHRRRGAGRHCRRRVKPAGGVLPGVCAVHGEVGRRGGQDRLSGRDQEALRRRQQLDRTEIL